MSKIRGMYIYNVTTNVSETVIEDWLVWMKETYIPEMIGTGCFTGAKLSRVMVQEEMGGKTFSTQYTVKNKEIFKEFYLTHVAIMNAKVEKKFSGNYVQFQTELEVLADIY